MNPTEQTKDIRAKFDKHIINPKDIQATFIQTPCQACGSSEHALLVPCSDNTTSPTIQYKYSCQIVNKQPLYNNGIEGIKITYILNARTYAEHHSYNLEEATGKNILGTTDSDIKPDFYHVFMNDVRRICVQHHSQNRTHYEIQTRTNKKRKIEDITDDRTKHTTPTKRK
jgi:hypothetical protein